MKFLDQTPLLKALAEEVEKAKNTPQPPTTNVDPKVIALIDKLTELIKTNGKMTDVVWRYSGQSILSLNGWIMALQNIVSLLFALIFTLAVFMLIIYVCYIFDINPKIILGNVLWMAGLLSLIFGISMWGSIKYIGKLFKEKVIMKQTADEVDAVFNKIVKQ